jgi:hypothetical protein
MTAFSRFINAKSLWSDGRCWSLKLNGGVWARGRNVCLSDSWAVNVDWSHSWTGNMRRA